MRLCVFSNTYQAQVIQDGSGNTLRELKLPPPDTEVLPGIKWGRADEVFSPAFWSATWWLSAKKRSVDKRITDQTSFKKEVAACLLGGFGITFEVNRAAFQALDRHGIFNDSKVQETAIWQILAAPIRVGARSIHYRFPRQKAKYLAATLNKLGECDPTGMKDLELREWLTTLPGIGYKTASWIIRNWRSSDCVAIIDIHILRAGVIMGLFQPHHDPVRHYFELETRFLQFARCIAAIPSELDLLIWDQMRISNRVGIRAMKERSSRI